MNTTYAGAILRHPTHSQALMAHRSTPLRCDHDHAGGLLSLLPATELRRLVAAMVD